MLQLQLPHISHQSGYLDMIREWGEFETIPTSPRALFRGDTFEEFLEMTKKDVIGNRFGVPAALFFLMDEETLLGAIQIRHHIDHPNLSPDGGAGGHIGYGLRPSTRGKGFAKIMLQLGLKKAKEIGIKKVLISANQDNPASWKTIESCGGVFDKQIESEGEILKLYWITL